jgi:hypothetical protein
MIAPEREPSLYPLLVRGSRGGPARSAVAERIDARLRLKSLVLPATCRLCRRVSAVVLAGSASQRRASRRPLWVLGGV